MLRSIVVFSTSLHRIKMASETGTSIVSNERCDVNNTIQEVFEPLETETTGVKVPRASWTGVIEETNEYSDNFALRPTRTPTIFPTASSYNTNTEGNELRRSANFMSSSGDVEEERINYKTAVITKLHTTSLEPHSMSNQKNDLDSVARLSEQPDGNII